MFLISSSWLQAHRYALGAVLYILAWTLFRLWFCGQLELTGDEAYYWEWSRHLDWAYYSKGPGIAWTIALGVWIGNKFGWIQDEGGVADSEFAIRWPAVILAAATAWLFFKLARDLFNAKTAFWSVIVASLVPLFVVGGFLMTIDPLSVFFWTLAAWLFWKNRDNPQGHAWMGAGLAIGLGMLCKYTNVAELFCFALFCMWVPQYRRELVGRKFWWMVIIALLCLIPVVLWNMKHHWPTLQHLVHRGALDEQWTFSLKELGRFLWKQFLVFNPLFVIGFLVAVLRLKKEEWGSTRICYLLSLFLPLFLFYIVLSVKKAGEANWTAPCAIAGVILLVERWNKWIDTDKLARWLCGIALALSIFLVVAAHILVFVPPQWLPTPDPLRRVRGWQDLADQIDQMWPANHRLVICDNYQLTALLSFYSCRYDCGSYSTYLLRQEGIKNQYALWTKEDYVKRFREMMPYEQSALYLSTHSEFSGQVAREFESVDSQGKEIVSLYQNKPMQKFYLFDCSHLGGKEEPIEIKPVAEPQE